MKRLSALLLAIVMVISLAACDSKKKKDDDDSPKAKSAEDVALEFVEDLFSKGMRTCEKNMIFTCEQMWRFDAYHDEYEDLEEYLLDHTKVSDVESSIDVLDEEIEEQIEEIEERQGVDFDPSYRVVETKDVSDDELEEIKGAIDSGNEIGVWDFSSEDIEDSCVVVIGAKWSEESEEIEDDLTMIKINGKWKVAWEII